MMQGAAGAVVAAALGLCGAAFGQGDERYHLDNGLRVILRPAAKSDRVGCIVLYDVGEQNDPAGRSGLCHLVEHLYVTAAAGTVPASTAERWMARYEGMVNAQTGRAYTVVAAVFPRDRLEEELAEAAARMGALRIEAPDLEREVPRMEAELANMYGTITLLTAMNLAAGAVAPPAEGARKGGVMDQVRAVTLDEVRQWHARHYKPGNATLALSGGFDPETARRRITALFGALPRGEPPPPPRPPAAPAPGLRRVAARPPPGGAAPATAAVAAVAFRAPAPGSALYAPFLIHAARLMQQEMGAAMLGRPSPFSVYFAPLDLPEIITVSTEPAAGQSDEDVAALLRGRVAAAVAPRDRPAPGRALVSQTFGPMLGVDGARRAFGEDPYFAAFCLGRRMQLGLDGPALASALDAVTADDLRRCAEEIFDPARSAVIVVRPE